MRLLFSFHRCTNLLCSFGLIAGSMITSLTVVASSHAAVVSFGNTNKFDMEFVTVGNPNNDPDIRDQFGAKPQVQGLGRLGYTYGIGKFEVSEFMITQYNLEYGVSNLLEITTSSRGPNKPATNVTWNEAARFVNWLNTSTGYQAAYKFAPGSTIDANIEVWTSGDVGYDSSNPYRNSLAKYALPTYNEWYKAAYYNPSTNTYFSYASGSNDFPAVTLGGVGANTAVFRFGTTQPTGPADVNNAGGLSPYSVMGLGGNVAEFEESSFDLTNSDGSLNRAFRGGAFNSNGGFMNSNSRNNSVIPTTSGSNIGFRVVSLSPSVPPPAVPEPTSMAIFGLGALGLAYRARRKSKA